MLLPVEWLKDYVDTELTGKNWPMDLHYQVPC